MPHSSQPRSKAAARKPNAVDVVWAAAALAVAVVWPLAEGVAAGTVLVISGVSLIVGLAVGLLPRSLVVFGYVAGVVGSLVISQVWHVGRYEWVSMVFGFLAGCVGGTALRYLSSQASRSSARTRSPQAVTGPVLSWDESGTQDETRNPTPPAVLDTIRALDGRRRTVVSVRRGTSRLDVAGDAAGAVLVFHTDNRNDRRVDWHHLTSPAAGDREVEVTVAGVSGHFRERQTTRLASALQAAEHYLATGERDPRLSWYGDRDVSEMRPGTLQSTD